MHQARKLFTNFSPNSFISFIASIAMVTSYSQRIQEDQVGRQVRGSLGVPANPLS